MLNIICILYKNHLRLTLPMAGGQARKTHVYWFREPPLEMEEYQCYEGKWVEGCLEKPVVALENCSHCSDKIDLSPYISRDEIFYQVMGVSELGKIVWRNVTEQRFYDFMKSLD